MNTRYSLSILCALFLLLQACGKDDDEPQNQTTSVPCLPTSLSANVIAYYPFSNGSLNDFSGNGMHLTNGTTAKVAPDRNGNGSCAFEFDNYPAKADSLTTAIVQKLTGVTVFSVSLWYMPLDTNVQTGSAKVEHILAYDKWNIMLYDCRKPSLGYWDKGINTAWSVWDNTHTGTNDCQQEQVFRTNVWSHVVVTFDKANNKAKIYRNGVLREEDGSFSQPTANFMPYQPANLVIGGSYTGRLDDIAIFNKVLTTAEINTLFQAAPCCSQ
jgi:hypothetical protein